ncbi:NAD(P)H:quinone oxidoreductase type IV [Negadavirga shengliensis]|uniref:NAD(P)H:quinone oxidoreductase type IV n=1 Tax=Negadavirga shengliensis TaxID=1389218 RepID=A0ABV9T873_9BACT
MEEVKLAIIYYSSTGTNYQLAKWAEEAGKNSEAAEVRFLRIRETAPEEAIQQNENWAKHVEATKDIPTVSLEDLEWADAFIFSAPTRYGNLPSQLTSFFDTTGGLWLKGKLVNKVVSGMTSSANTHGGQESTLLSLYKSMYHWGAIIVTPAYTSEVQFEAGGNPYGVSVSEGKDNLNDNIKEAVFHQAKRTLTLARWVKAGFSGG